MNISESAGGIITNGKGEVIVVEQKNNTWSLPKGHVEAGEDYVQTAIREIKEETGITEVEYVKAFEPYERFKMVTKAEEDPTEKKKLHFFLFTTKQTVLKPIDPDNPQARWVKKEEVTKLLTHAKDIEFFNSIISEI